MKLSAPSCEINISGFPLRERHRNRHTKKMLEGDESGFSFYHFGFGASIINDDFASILGENQLIICEREKQSEPSRSSSRGSILRLHNDRRINKRSSHLKPISTRVRSGTDIIIAITFSPLITKIS